MPDQDLIDRLQFIQSAERLKNVLRSGHTSEGRRESTPEHTWRLCLLAMVLRDRLPPLDLERLLKMCVLHDLGEALHGDVPAVDQAAPGAKAAVLNYISNNPTCGQVTTFFTANASGGTPLYTYSWTGFSVGATPFVNGPTIDNTNANNGCYYWK